MSNGSRSPMGNSISQRSCWVSNTFTRSRSASGDGINYDGSENGSLE